jgi:predicted metal-dependent hydrolase
MSIFPTYTHIVNHKLKHVYLTFSPEGELIIKSPKISQSALEKILIRKSAWITKTRQKIEYKKGKEPSFAGKDDLFFLGIAYPLHMEQNSAQRCRLSFCEIDGFLIEYSDFDTELFGRSVDLFYKKEAKKHISALVDRYAATMGLFPSKISFRKAKRRWGSCSGADAISFNYLAMKLPHDVIEYLVVHELAHIRHKHHQKSFWKLVETHTPEYREREKELKTFFL